MLSGNPNILSSVTAMICPAEYVIVGNNIFGKETKDNKKCPQSI